MPDAPADVTAAIEELIEAYHAISPMRTKMGPDTAIGYASETPIEP